MKQSGFRLFLLIWIGSLISEIGSGMTSFALGVYIFQLTCCSLLWGKKPVVFCSAALVSASSSSSSIHLLHFYGHR